MPLCNCFRRRSWEKCERGYKGCVYNGGKGSLGAVLLGVFFQELLSLTRSWLNALLYNYKNTNVLILWLKVYYNPYYPGQHLLQLLFLVSTLYFKSCSLVDVVFFSFWTFKDICSVPLVWLSDEVYCPCFNFVMGLG